MLENLTNSDVLILMGLIGLIIVIGVICIILTLKGGKKVSPNKVKKEESNFGEPDIHIALATDNIPAIEDNSIKMEEAPKEENFEEIIDIDAEEKQSFQPKESSDFDYEQYYNSSNENILEPIVPFYEEEILAPNESLDLEEKQDIKNGAAIEEVLKTMQDDLEKQKYETIDRYEEEQEENAVISYQELLQRKMNINENEEIKEEKEELATPDYLDDIPDFKDIVLEPIPDRRDDRPFVNSEFVSPIFGRLSSNVDYPTVKKTVETEELIQTEIFPEDDFNISDENDEFLNTLKEFRRNL